MAVKLLRPYAGKSPQYIYIGSNADAEGLLVATGTATFNIEDAIDYAAYRQTVLGQQQIANGEAAGLAALGVTSAPKLEMPFFRGVNIAGMDRYINSETEPTPAGLRWIAKKGFNLVRLMLKWNSFQAPTNGLPSGPLNAAYLAKVKRVVNLMTGLGIWVILDDHSSFRYKTTGTDSDTGAIVGQSAVTADMCGAFWTLLANEFKANPRVMFEPANEPHDMDQPTLITTYQTVINAIRATGANNVIVIDGNNYSTAEGWLTGSPPPGSTLIALTDPVNNLLLSPHQYLDKAGGTLTVCYTGAGPIALSDVTTWARANKVKLFLGEFGGGDNATCYQALKETVDFCEGNRDVWQGWAVFAVYAGQRSYVTPDTFFLAMDPDNYENQPVDDNRIVNAFDPYLKDALGTPTVTAIAATAFSGNGGTLTNTTANDGVTAARKIVLDTTNTEHGLYGPGLASVAGKKHTFICDVAVDVGAPQILVKISDTTSYSNATYACFDPAQGTFTFINTSNNSKMTRPTVTVRQLEAKVWRLTISTLIADTTGATTIVGNVILLPVGFTAPANWTGDGTTAIRVSNAKWKVQ